MNYRKKIRKAIECPQFSGTSNYGEWGALRFEQRVLIKRLLDELNNTDECVKKLYKENEQLKARLELFENGIYFSRENDRLEEENDKLKKQLEYLRSGEYYNQLKFENEMLQQVVDTNGVPSEVYDYIDCTHRNTELLEQQQEFINYLERKLFILHDEMTELTIEMCNTDYQNTKLKIYQEILQKYREIIGEK